MTTTSGSRYVGRQLERLGRVRHHVHSGLKGVLYELETTIEHFGSEGVVQPGSRSVDGPGGQWTVAWLISGGQPWVTLQWPRRAPSLMIDHLCSQALRFALAVHRQGNVDYDRLWIPLNAQ